MLNLTELMDIGCAHTVTDSDGWMYPCGKPIVAIRRWPDEGDGKPLDGEPGETITDALRRIGYRLEES